MKRSIPFLFIGILLLILTGCMTKTGTVSGQVTDQMGTPIPDVTVLVGNLSTATDGEGYFTAKKISAGTQTVKAAKAGYQEYSGTVAVVAGKTTTLTIAIMTAQPAGNLLGVVTDSLTDLPLSGATVKFGTVTAITDSAGKYRFLNIIPGNYSVEVSRIGYTSKVSAAAIEANRAKTLDFQLVSTLHGNVTGVVRDKGGKPLSGVTVFAAGKSAASGTDGRYCIYALPKGLQTVTAAKTGYETAAGQVNVQAGTQATLDFQLTATSVIQGYVTDGRGGPGVADARLTYAAVTAKTNGNGSFTANVPRETIADLFVEKADRGTVRVQDLRLAEGEVMDLEIPSMPLFNPNWSKNPPIITVNIYPDQLLSGTVPVQVRAAGERPILKVYVYFSGEQRFPAQAVADGTDGSVSFNLNTALYPNGRQILRVLAYDDNGNAALLRLPTEVSNLPAGSAQPKEMTPIEITSYTFGQNIGFYQYQQADFADRKGIRTGQLELPGRTLDLMAAPPNSNLFVSLKWTMVEGADGFSVYRSLNGTDFTLIGNVKGLQCEDFSAQLTVNQKIHYRIVPYNSAGVGQGREIYVIPTPPFNVQLLTPANQQSDVPLTPTFTWKIQPHPGYWSPLEYYSMIKLYDAQGTELWQTMTNSKSSIVYNGELKPGHMYAWDITQCYTDTVYATSAGTSRALSIAGPYVQGAFYGVGSLNGQFIFTTTTSTQ